MSMIKELALKRKHKWTTNIRRYPISLIFSEMQSKTIIKSHSTLNRTAKIKQMDNTQN